MISLALKHRLTDKSVVNKQQIHPALVNIALPKIAQINPFYSNITIHKELKESSAHFPTVMYNVDGPNISPNEIVNIAAGEGEIPVSFTSEPNWEASAFPKDYSTGRNLFNEEREIPITPSKYVHARLECWDDRFASNFQYIFQALD